jgi:hypothetical protein
MSGEFKLDAFQGWSGGGSILALAAGQVHRRRHKLTD